MRKGLRMQRAVFTLCMTVGLGLCAGAQQVQTLDEVISQAAKTVEAKLSQGSKLAILNFSSWGTQGCQIAMI
jgi:hypothetical protein